MVNYGGLTFEGRVVQIADGVAQNANIIRTVVLSQEVAEAIVVELVNAYEELAMKEDGKENHITPVYITDMNTQEVIKMLDKVETVEELDVFKEEEEHNEDYRYPGGRKGVLAVIQARREDIQSR